jgi:hypothetical protein
MPAPAAGTGELGHWLNQSRPLRRGTVLGYRIVWTCRLLLLGAHKYGMQMPCGLSPPRAGAVLSEPVVRCKTAHGLM